MTDNGDVQGSNGHNKEGKESLDHLYDLEDPRGYFKTLWRLDYSAPWNGHLFFPSLVRAKRHDGGRGEEGVTDVGLACSYGVNGALLK